MANETATCVFPLPEFDDDEYGVSSELMRHINGLLTVLSCPAIHQATELARAIAPHMRNWSLKTATPEQRERAFRA